jgi:hypothetical protein
MIGLNDVVKNWGDFDTSGTWHANFGGMREGQDPRRFAAVDMVPDSSGAFSASDREPGYGRVSNYTRAVVAQRGRRYYESRMAEAASIIFRGFNGSKRDLLNLQEAMSISDFPNLFGDVIDRAVLANYLETPYTWNLIANQSEVNDFRPVKRFRIDGGTGLMSSLDANGNLIPLEQGAQYPEDSLSDGLYTYQLRKYGKRMPFFWETFVNDDLNALKDTPARFGRGARRTEEYFVTKLFANNVSGTAGPNGFFFYSNGNKNIVNAANAGGAFVANNPALTITALQQAIVVMMNQLDTTGQPISVEAMTLVVPPALKTIAMNILNTDYVFMADQGGTQQINGANLSATVAQQLHAMNWAKNIVRLAVNYYLPIVDTSHGTTGWYLFSNPENGRPALEMGKLRGHLTPELFMKLPNSVAIGEGTMGPGPGVIPGTSSMNPLEGDFDTDSIHYKIRNVFGGVQVDPIMTVYSNGTNS